MERTFQNTLEIVQEFSMEGTLKVSLIGHNIGYSLEENPPEHLYGANNLKMSKNNLDLDKMF